MFIDEFNTGHEIFPVYTYDCDARYEALPSLFFKMIQETAGLHAKLRGASLPDLNREGKTWVVTRTQMDIFRYPSWTETVEVVTGVPDAKSFFAPRAFEAADGEGRPVFSALSMWAVLEVDTRRPLRMAELSQRLVPAARTDGAFGRLDSRSPKIDSAGFREKPCINVYKPQICFYDTDINRHINNVVYVDWFLDSLPAFYMKNHKPSFIDVSWHHEVHADNSIEVQVYELGGDRFGFIMLNTETDAEVSMAKMAFVNV